ncbi:alpha/beta fold hydrolase [Streptomyces xiaopingdaonensis]|uniref:alpha/beta fold hydrolase n=1 Tax=Streptomyces xiaopingdaonensis TaxID=1565415 RepID=UPI0002EB409F|nr:alpha/beta hydrolase [Streptomyces xiaopingdaonensis]
MKLRVRTWGEGERTVLLVHGLAADSGTWHDIACELAEWGHRVVAPDLRGHGRSPRGYYSPEALASDLVDTLPKGAHLAVGHSFGAAALTLAAQELAPGRLVYAEPYWNIAAVGELPEAETANRLMGTERDQIAAQHPEWPSEAVAAEAEARSRWDPRTMVDLHAFDMPCTPGAAEVPSLVLRAELPSAAPALDEPLLRRRGFDVATVQGAGHVLHRDRPKAFLAALRPLL